MAKAKSTSARACAESSNCGSWRSHAAAAVHRSGLEEGSPHQYQNHDLNRREATSRAVGELRRGERPRPAMLVTKAVCPGRTSAGNIGAQQFRSDGAKNPRVRWSL